MWKRVVPQRAITLTKLSVAMACNWPPSPYASESQLFVYNLLWCASFLSSMSLFVPLLVAIYEFRNDLVVVGKSMCLTAGVSQVMIKMVMCRVQLKNFRMLYFEMETFCRDATGEERIVLQRYVDRYKYIHGIYVLWCFLIAGFVIASPLYLPQSFPTHAVYPFSVEHPLLKLFVFFHQTLVGIQTSSGLAIDTQIAMLLRYAAVRFELLGSQLRNAKSVHEFNACIEKHDKLLRYTRKIRRTVKLLILTTISTTIVAVTFGSLNLITKQPLRLKVLYAILALSASVELFMYAWPADNLTQLSSKIATDAYHTDWYERDTRIQKMILYVILRSQKLEAIRISGIVPNVSLSYYAQYLYASFSYFTALRIMLESSVPNETL